MKRITESQLRKLIESKVKRMLKENNLEKQQQMDYEGLYEEIYDNVCRQLNESANNYQEAISYLTNAYRCVMQYSKQSIGNNGNNVFPSIAKQIGNIIGQINRLSDPWGTKGQENLRQTGWG